MIVELSEVIKNSIYECLEDEVAISYSGGVDSSLIAWVSREGSSPHLFTAGTPESKDILSARESSKLLGLQYTEIIIDESSAIDAYKELYKMLRLDFLKLEILVPLYLAAKKAKEMGYSTMLYGSGAEELFVGYDRYYRYLNEGKDLDSILRDEFRTLKNRELKWIKKMCYSLGIEARTPYYNKRIAELVFEIPLEDRMSDKEKKKGILGEVGVLLGLPKSIIERKKTAAQYGSGVHKLLIRYAKQNGLEGSIYDTEANSR